MTSIGLAAEHGNSSFWRGLRIRSEKYPRPAGTLAQPIDPRSLASQWSGRHAAAADAAVPMQVDMRFARPSGQITSYYRKKSQALPGKIFLFRFFVKSWLSLPVPHPPREALRDSHEVLGAGCDGRVGCVRRTRQMRTAKSCGPDPPTLGSSSRDDCRHGTGCRQARLEANFLISSAGLVRPGCSDLKCPS